MSDADFESSVGQVVGVNTIQTLSLITTVSLTTAQFFTTSQLLPQAKLGFTLTVIAYTGAAIALIVAIADGYIRGEIEWVDAITSLFTLTWGVIFGDETLAAHTVFSRVFKCLSKYRVATIESWIYHDTILQCAWVLLLFLGFAVRGAIALSGPRQ